MEHVVNHLRKKNRNFRRNVSDVHIIKGKKKDNERAEYIRSADIEDIKAEVIEAAINEARKEVIRLLGGVISGMNVGQPVIMQAANSEAQEPTEDVMDDADVAGLAMRWMSKGD